LSLGTKTARLTGNWKAVKVDGKKLFSSGNLLTLYFEQDEDLAIASSYYFTNGQYHIDRGNGKRGNRNKPKWIQTRLGNSKTDK
jgi:hypothetical protein